MKKSKENGDNTFSLPLSHTPHGCAHRGASSHPRVSPAFVEDSFEDSHSGQMSTLSMTRTARRRPAAAPAAGRSFMTAFSTALAPAHASPGSRCSQASQGASPSSSCWQQTNKGRRGRAGTLVPDSLLPRLVGSRQTKAGEAGRGRWCRTHTSPSGERRRVVHGDRKVEEGGGDEARARADEGGGREPKADPVFLELQKHPRRRWQLAEAACPF
jgi:hypothetical protein